jgi:hypothetical protein
MHDGPIELNIGNVCGGAVSELFEHEVARIMKNIGDVNTNPEEKRSLTLEFKFKPSPDRKSAVVTLACKSKVAGLNPVAGSVFMTSAQGTVRAFTEDPRQSKLFAAQPAATPQPQ